LFAIPVDTRSIVTFTSRDIETFKKDHLAYQRFRKGMPGDTRTWHRTYIQLTVKTDVELELQSIHGITLTGHSMQLGEQEVFAENMKRRLANKPGLIDELHPSFPPACRRLTPGPGYLEALTDDKVNLITSDIVKVDETGIITADGHHRPVDMLVCATGFDTSYTPRFVIKGREGVTLAERWEQTPETYLSTATDGFPNYFISLGPNAGLGEGNLLLLIERALDYVTECVHKMQRDNIRAMSVRREAVKRFTQYCNAYFAGTVFSSKCRSWYKGGTEDGRVTALWPGMCWLLKFSLHWY
jgi:cation diffusion facilitator CzcD-associated flavoprotein CzcO